MLANDLVLDLFFSLHTRLRVTTLACQVHPSVLPMFYSRVGVAQPWESRDFLNYMDYQPSKKKKMTLGTDNIGQGQVGHILFHTEMSLEGPELNVLALFP